MTRKINDRWFFAKLPCGSTISDAEKACYTPVDLPHDWLIWNQDDLYESADAWYYRQLFPDECSGPVTMLRFDGIYMDCDIMLNGEVIYSHPYGYTSFLVPLTGKLRSGENRITVHIRHQSPNSRWYSGSGIYRDVELINLPVDHLIPDSVYIAEREEKGSWILTVSADTEGNTPRQFSCTLTDRDGKTAVQQTGQYVNGTATITMTVCNGRNWSPDDPYLYTLQLNYGKQTEVLKIGLRTVALDPDKGMFLNGSRIKLKGVCLHHDLGALGSAFHEKAARRQLNLMKNMGVNAVRTSHNPPASRFLDLCDEMGILVVDEAFDMWERSKTTYDYARFFNEWWQKDVASWVRRDRCHPCVIMWSVGNEIFDMHADIRGTELTGLLSAEVRRHDPDCHAYTTFGCNYMPWEGGQRCAAHVDAVGYNYGEKLYDAHHASHPDWVIYGSETSSILSSRGIYHFPASESIMSEADEQCSSLGNSNTSWGAEDLRKMIVEDQLNSFSLGQFIWSGIDYIGEPTPYHTRSCYFGQADTACYPKDSYYLFQSLWTDKKMIHIGVVWDWNPGQMIDVPVMTNCAEAELLLNGMSLGRRIVDSSDPERCLPMWRIPFVKGKLIARGYDEQGRTICEDIRITPGEPEQLVLSCENEFILGDGKDLAFVTVSVTDAEGQTVDNARDYVRVTVDGGGRLLGTDNGDSTDHDSYKSNCRRLFSGKLLLIIGSDGREENVTVHAESIRCGKCDMTIPVHPAKKEDGISCLQRLSDTKLHDRIPVRKLEILPLGNAMLNAEHPFCSFQYSVFPHDATYQKIKWEVTNATGIQSPYAELTIDEESIGEGRVTVYAKGDGAFYLRGLCGEEGRVDLISQIELTAEGIGTPMLNPYEYLSAGLYDLCEGEIGTGNEKGIAFARDGESMVGFSSLDFGKTGSDTLTMDIFALNGDAYDIELWTGKTAESLQKTDVLRYQKPSLWNVYQPETWVLSRRLTSVQTICFRMKKKVHFKGFCFQKQENAYIRHTAGSMDSIYGDQFQQTGDSVVNIGNNVTLTWTEMDFGTGGERILELEGNPHIPVNAVTVRIKNTHGETATEVADFVRDGPASQQFRIKVPSGICSVSFVFLPGSSFDFHAFRFSMP